jgi:hypothetical protein
MKREEGINVIHHSGFRLTPVLLVLLVIALPPSSFIRQSVYAASGRDSVTSVTSEDTNVIPVLFIPKNLTADTQYSSAINDALLIISSWYAGQLTGRTFNYLPVQTVIGKYNLDHYCPKTTVSTQCIQVPGEVGADSGDVFTVANELAEDGYVITDNTILLIFWVGGYGYAGGSQYSSSSGLAAVGDWALDGIAGKYEAGTATSRCSDSKFAAAFCRNTAQLGSIGHELGHAFGLPHPTDDGRTSDDPNFWLTSIMGAFGDFPRVRFIDSPTNPEKTKLLQHPFFQSVHSASVQPVLFIPNNIATDVTYVKAINEAVAEVRQWYAKQLDRHTFHFNSVQTVIGKYPLRHYCPKTIVENQCIQVSGELGADADDIKNVLDDLRSQGYPLSSTSVMLVFWVGSYGFADARQLSSNSGYAALGDWALDGIAGKYEMGTATSHCTDSSLATVYCKRDAQLGAIAYILSQAFGLPESSEDGKPADDPNYYLKSFTRTW